jgi:hypothetical protein
LTVAVGLESKRRERERERERERGREEIASELGEALLGSGEPCSEVVKA